jgi:hypothetical protein
MRRQSYLGRAKRPDMQVMDIGNSLKAGKGRFNLVQFDSRRNAR